MYQILGVGLVVVALAGVVCAGLVTREIRVAIDVPLRVAGPEREAEIFRRLRSVHGAPLTAASYGRYHLGKRGLSVATVLLAILFFPFGLLFLLMRTGTSLELTLIEGPRPSLRIVGKAERHVWRRICQALAPLSGPTALPNGTWETGSDLTATG
jgi:hypothetical protein